MPGGGLYTPTEFVVYSGITDADGNAAKTTLKCSAIGSASAYPDFDGNQIIITSGDYKGQARDIDGATNGDAAGTITVANAFDGKILEGTLFLIMGIRTVPAEIAALEGKVDNILLDTQLKFAVSGSKTIASGAEKYLDIDSGTDGAEIISITIKGIVGADWTVELYIPTDDAVASPAAGDKRAEESYISTDTEGGQLAGIGAIRYNMLLDFTNDSAAPNNVDEVVVAYRSRGTLTLTWE